MEDLLRTIENLYSLSSLSHLERVEKGILSENHVLESVGVKYFLKKYRSLGTERIREIHSAKKFFADGGIPVILPLDTEKGSTFFEYKGSHYALFPFINGTHINRGNFDAHSARELGAMLGKIHARGEKAKIPIVVGTNACTWDAMNAPNRLSRIKNAAENASPRTEFDDLVLHVVAIKERCMKESSVTPSELGLTAATLTHGDYLDHNVFFNTERKLIAVFDWEKVDYEPRTYELWRCLTYALIIGNGDHKEIVLAAHFLNAYRKNVQIGETELRNGFVLFYEKMIHSFWIEEEHYLKNNTRPDHLLKESFPRFVWLTEHHKEFVDMVLTQSLQ